MSNMKPIKPEKPYVEITSLTGHASKFLYQVKRFVTGGSFRYGSTLDKIETACNEVIEGLNLLFKHIGNGKHIEIVNDGETYQASSQWSWEDVQNSDIFKSFLKQHDEAIVKAALEGVVAAGHPRIDYTIVEQSEDDIEEKPKRKRGRPPKQKHETNKSSSVKSKTSSKSTSAVQEDNKSDMYDITPDFEGIAEEEPEIIEEEKEEEKPKYTASDYVKDLGKIIAIGVEPDCKFSNPETAIFARCIKSWYDVGIIRRRNYNPDFNYNPKMLGPAISKFAIYAGELLSEQKPDCNLSGKDVWRPFEKFVDGWLEEIKTNSKNRYFTPKEITLIDFKNNSHANYRGIRILQDYMLSLSEYLKTHEDYRQSILKISDNMFYNICPSNCLINDFFNKIGPRDIVNADKSSYAKSFPNGYGFGTTKEERNSWLVGSRKMYDKISLQDDILKDISDFSYPGVYSDSVIKDRLRNYNKDDEEGTRTLDRKHI